MADDWWLSVSGGWLVMGGRLLSSGWRAVSDGHLVVDDECLGLVDVGRRLVVPYLTCIAEGSL